MSRPRKRREKRATANNRIGDLEMALPVVRYAANEIALEAHSLSIGASPIVAEIRAPTRGRLVKVACVTGGTITTSNATITVAIGGTTVTGAAITVNFS